MVISIEQKQKRLTIQTVEIAPDTMAIRSLDWDRDRFDIEFGLQNGTTYNSFLIRGEKTALIDTSHRKFRQLYLDNLAEIIAPSQIDYLIVSHTEPDHSGLVKEIIELAPKVTVVGAKTAIHFMENWIHHPFERKIVKNGDQIDLGKGHILEFVNAPNLHWPDTIFSYDAKTQVLYSCDAFGMHYCSDSVFDRDLAVIELDYQFYYECLMAPNARSVLSALKRMDKLGQVKTIANGHGPLLRQNVEELVNRYRNWSQAQAKTENLVLVFYVSHYGYSDRLAQSIARGLIKTGVGVEMIDLKTADPQQMQKLVSTAEGIAIGMPSALDATAIAAVNTILGTAKSKQVFGLFESYGGDDEPIDSLLSQLKNLGLTTIFPPIRVKEIPSETTYHVCEEAGIDMGQYLRRDDKITKLKSLNPNLEKALGRLSSGLYIITVVKGNIKSAMLASWVSKASLKPLGLTIAIAKEQAMESLMQVGDRFVLNVLAESNYQTVMKHFLKRLPPGADRFTEVKTQPASNGSPILTDALAYMECQVKNRIECSDHWIIYAEVEVGQVLKSGFAAVHHRKVGNHY
ncbi:MAG: diflavin flavoprotein [Xenococcaceae cyanobacterium MO_188.B29]|nr:diflavin flavoprotein [Xenococcaceae cyanobacterium MO_188.B29]